MASVLDLSSFAKSSDDSHKFKPSFIDMAELRERARLLSRKHVGKAPWPGDYIKDLEKMIRASVNGVVSTHMRKATNTLEFSTQDRAAGYGYGVRLNPDWLKS